MMKEIQLKRFAGPFEDPPFPQYIQSPVGLVPNGPDGKDTWLVFHLSWPKNGDSMNSNTPEECCTVKYKDLDDVIHLCLETGRTC